MLNSLVYGNTPQNQGLTRPITNTAPLVCLANPVFTAPVIAWFCPDSLLADTVMKAQAQAAPKQVSAGIGNPRVVAISGLNEGKHPVYMEIMEGSCGGRFGRDGMDTVDTFHANTRNYPVEDIRSQIPLRVNRHEQREDRKAPVAWRGGIGTALESAFLSDAGFSIEWDGYAYQP